MKELTDKVVEVTSNTLKLKIPYLDSDMMLEGCRGVVKYEGDNLYIVALDDLDLFISLGLLTSNEIVADKRNFTLAGGVDCEDDLKPGIDEDCCCEPPVDEVVHTTFGKHIVRNDGAHHEFPTGAIRSTNIGKPRLDLISPYALEALGECFGDNANEYGEGNYLLGIPPMKTIESLLRHLNIVQQGFIEGNQDKIAEYKNVLTNAIMLGHSMKLIEKGLYLEKF
jgi:hypothetical protein